MGLKYAFLSTLLRVLPPTPGPGRQVASPGQGPARVLPGGLGVDAWGQERRRGSSSGGQRTSGCGLRRSLQLGCPVSAQQAGQCFEAPPFEKWPYQHHPRPKPHQTRLGLGGACTSKPQKIHHPLPLKSSCALLLPGPCDPLSDPGGHLRPSPHSQSASQARTSPSS